MFFSLRNVHDISHTNDFFFRFRGNDALTRRDKQHLIAAMDVHFVARTGGEIDDVEAEVFACLCCQQWLPCHGAACEQRTVRWFCRNPIWFEHLHSSILLYSL